ncbi:MAG: hypothetical protein KatS3mg105_2186 [Gemmatales bacterium]|nr:MAG: hypothetical protein KatS3mg105_2186 [Gemmatales bacterium]
MVWPILRRRCVLRFRGSGRLVPWLGPTLRGLVARLFRDNVCRQPVADRFGKWRYCKGCEYMNDCSYGMTLEPDAGASEVFFQGQGDIARPVVFAPSFPCPRVCQTGTELPLEILFLGRRAAQQVEMLWAMLEKAGQRSILGPDGIAFDVLGTEDREETIALPTTLADEEGEIGRVEIALQSPLTLHTERPEPGCPVRQTRWGSRPRFLLLRPTFADLFRASARVLGALYALEFNRRLDADFETLKHCANEVALESASYEYFEQRRASSRSGERLARGIVGRGWYGPVPKALFAWVQWGGVVHVGTDRVAGAGRWQLRPASD